jgi:WD40 repeat protein
MPRGTHHTLIALALTALAACASPDAAPPATPSAMNAPTSAPSTTALSGREVTPAPASIPAPVVAPSVTLPPMQPSAAPSATAQPVPQLPEPTATPVFPEPRIAADNLSSLQLLRTVGYGGARHAAIAPDNSLLAVATTAGVALFELPSLRHKRFDVIPGGAVAVAFSDDAQALLVTLAGAGDQQLQWRQIADGTIETTLPIAFEPRPTELLSPSNAIRATLHPPDSMPAPGVVLSHIAGGAVIYRDNETLAVSFSADETRAALVTYRGDVRLVDLADGRVQGELALPPYWGVGFSPDAQTLVATGHTLWLWEVMAGTARALPLAFGTATPEHMFDAQQRVRLNADGSVLTVEGDYFFFEATLLRGSAFRIANGSFAPAWESSAGGFGVVNDATYVGAISPASDATALTNDGVMLSINGGGAPPRMLEIPQGISALAFSPDGELLAIGEKGGAVRFVNVGAGAETARFSVGGTVERLVFSPDGALLGIRIPGGVIESVRVADTKPVARVRDIAPRAEHMGTLSGSDGFLFTADAELLIAWDSTSVRFHQLSDGSLLHTLQGGASEAAIGPRRRLLALLHDGRVTLWGVP